MATEKRLTRLPKSTCLFEVPNNPLGRLFIQYIRKYLNRSAGRLRIRGRNKDCKSLWVMGVPRNFNDDVPLEYADRFAVYIDRREPRQPESQGLGYLIG